MMACRDCRFFVTMLGTDRERIPREKANYGHCHFFPGTPPQVKADHWCGQFIQIQEDDGTKRLREPKKR